MQDKPALTCMVGRPILDKKGHWYGYVTDEETVTLEAAAELHSKGWVVLVDPSDEQALARWEMIQRSRGL